MLIMNLSHKKIGDYGERVCKNYLMKLGYNILELNYSSRYGEIDIIASKDEYLAFVEVKTRAKNSIVKGCEAVNKSKMLKIIKTAYQYLQFFNLDLQPRFDVCEIYIYKNVVDKINYIKNAFNLNSVGEYNLNL